MSALLLLPQAQSAKAPEIVEGAEQQMIVQSADAEVAVNIISKTDVVDDYQARHNI